MRWTRHLATAALLALLAACGAADKSAPRVAADTVPEAPEPFARIAIVQAGPLSGLHFEHYGVNPTVETREQAESSFGLQAERASFDLARMQIAANALPAKASVRVEDFVNAVRPPVAAPSDSDTFTLDAEAFPSPNRPGYHVLRISLAAAARAERPRRVVMVLDLADPAGLPLVQAAIGQVIAQLGATGELALVDVAGRVLLPVSPARDPRVQRVIEALELGSGPQVAGLELAFGLAARDGALDRQVIYCADGMVRHDARTVDRLIAAARRGAALGVGLTAIGVGRQQYDDARMARLALAAGGRYLYLAEGRGDARLLTDRVVARGAHARLRFDPAGVIRYRLLGHERHAERAADRYVHPGANVPAGATVTVLYEVKLAPGAGALGALRIDYADEGGQVRTLERGLPRSLVRAEASPYGRVTLVAAALAEKLRGAWWVRGVTYAQLQEQLAALPPAARDAELSALLDAAARLDQRGDPYPDAAPVAQMTFDHVPITRR